jgi:hypothetical protein
MDRFLQAEDTAFGEGTEAPHPPLGMTAIYFALMLHLLKFFFLPGQYSSIYAFLLHPGETLRFFTESPFNQIFLYLIGSVQDALFLILVLTLLVLYAKRAPVFRTMYLCYLALNAVFSLLMALSASVATGLHPVPDLKFLWALAGAHVLALGMVWPTCTAPGPVSISTNLSWPRMRRGPAPTSGCAR